MPQQALRVLLIALGLISTGLAVAGIFLPLVPTVPLLLLAAACFARSSETFYRWLTNHPRLGPIVRTYRDGRGIPLRAKVAAVALLWVSIALSVAFTGRGWVRVLLLTIAALLTLYLLRLPTRAAHDPSAGREGAV